MTPPCRCLLGDFPEGKELAELDADYVTSLPGGVSRRPRRNLPAAERLPDCAELSTEPAGYAGATWRPASAKAGDGLIRGAAEVGSGSAIHRAFPPNLTGRICRCSFQLLHPAVFPAGFCFALPHAKKH